MSSTRSRIATAIEHHPGIHFSGLVRRLDIAPGQVQYHVKKLQRTDAIVSESLYGQTHYYPREFEHWDRRACALLRRETSSDIVAYLLTHGPTGPATVARDLDIARSTLSWHVGRLVEQDLVAKYEDDPNGVRLGLKRPRATARILREVDPTLWDQLVGRFARLVDRLLE